MVIDVEQVSKVYVDGAQRRKVTALEGISLSVGDGEFVCVLGPSGCGKSTLLNLIAGFEQPTTGRVQFCGKPIAGPGPERAVVFQEPTLFP